MGRLDVNTGEGSSRNLDGFSYKSDNGGVRDKEKPMTHAIEREPTLADIVAKLETLTEDVERSNERFANYQQALQWMIQLAFSLIASATVTIVISAVLRR
jgi:hypothetical protein